MKFHNIDPSEIGPILGQLVIIAAMTWTARMAVMQMKRMPYGGIFWSFYHILVNRFRYFHQVGMKETLKLINPFRPHYKSEYSPYNESYTWLLENKIYIKYLFFFLSTITLIGMQIVQFGTGEIFIKPSATFVAGPIRSMMIVFIIGSLIDDVNRARKKLSEEIKKNAALREKLFSLSQMVINKS